MNAVAPDDLGRASGAYMTMRQLGGVFGLAITVAVFTAAGSYVSPAAFGDGFVPALAVAAAFSLAGSVVALALPARRPVPSPETAPAAASASASAAGPAGAFSGASS